MNIAALRSTDEAIDSRALQPSFHDRVCPLLERATPTKPIPYAPAPWDLRQCTESGFVYLRNAPAYEHLIDDMPWETRSRAESQARARAEPVRYAISTAIKRFRARFLKRSTVVTLTADLVTRCTASPQIRIVDLGCGWGQLLGEVMDRVSPETRSRCVPVGVEISRELARLSQAALARHGGTCIHANALQGLQRLAPESLDIVVMSSFLEHEVQPMPLLRECATTLRPQGHVVVKVPNYASWNRYLRGARWCGFRWPEHVNYFTPATLQAFASAAGFQACAVPLKHRFPLSDSLYAVLQRV